MRWNGGKLDKEKEIGRGKENGQKGDQRLDAKRGLVRWSDGRLASSKGRKMTGAEVGF